MGAKTDKYRGHILHIITHIHSVYRTLCCPQAYQSLSILTAQQVEWPGLRVLTDCMRVDCR